MKSIRQIEGETGLPIPKEAGQRETILVRMDDFPKVCAKIQNIEIDLSSGFRDLLEAAG